MTKKTVSSPVKGEPPSVSERERTTYSKEFKMMAVRRMREGALNATDLALDLGIRRNQLYKWAKAFDAKGEDGFPGAGRLPAGQENELTRLRRELALANEEIAILKKFDAYLTRPKK